MIELSAKAARQLRQLRDYYETTERPEAIRNLIAAIIEAAEQIERDPGCGLAAPRPYPTLARPGRRWIKQGSYWIAYRTAGPAVILALFYDTANIPGRDRPP